MSDYYEKETYRTPRLKGSAKTGEIAIIGKSLPEDAKDFYLPFREWLTKLFVSDVPSISFQIELEYFNSATSKILIDMLLNLEKLKDTRTVSVVWAYDEDDMEMEDTGKDFASLLGDMITLRPKPFVPN